MLDIWLDIPCAGMKLLCAVCHRANGTAGNTLENWQNIPGNADIVDNWALDNSCNNDDSWDNIARIRVELALAKLSLSSLVSSSVLPCLSAGQLRGASSLLAPDDRRTVAEKGGSAADGSYFLICRYQYLRPAANMPARTLFVGH